MIKILELFGGLRVMVHSDGTIETMDHDTLRYNGKMDNRKGRSLKPAINKYGYHQVVLTSKGTRRTYTVHQLVARAYLDNNQNKPTVKNA